MKSPGWIPLMIGVAVIFAMCAGLIWFAFLRPVPMQTALAEIKSKSA